MVSEDRPIKKGDVVRRKSDNCRFTVVAQCASCGSPVLDNAVHVDDGDYVLELGSALNDETSPAVVSAARME